MRQAKSRQSIGGCRGAFAETKIEAAHNAAGIAAPEQNFAEKGFAVQHAHLLKRNGKHIAHAACRKRRFLFALRAEQGQRRIK